MPTYKNINKQTYTHGCNGMHIHRIYPHTITYPSISLPISIYLLFIYAKVPCPNLLCHKPSGVAACHLCRPGSGTTDVFRVRLEFEHDTRDCRTKHFLDVFRFWGHLLDPSFISIYLHGPKHIFKRYDEI